MKMFIPALLLVFTISCTKENLNKPANSLSVTESSQSTVGDSIFLGAKYEGGIIFWIDGTGEHGLIAAKENIGENVVWSQRPSIVTGATKKVIGSGPANTRKIVSALGTDSIYAALLCTNYRSRGFNDWFLPSIDELSQLYAQKELVGGFPDNLFLYASSTEGKQHPIYAAGIDFTNGDVVLSGKENIFNVRPVRKF